MQFKDMGLSPKMMKGIGAINYEKATPIQEQVIPELLGQKRDLIGLAQTGTGKTAAYGIPVLENIDPEQNSIQVLILSPTRELCVQIGKDMEAFSRYMFDINTLTVYGGASIENQISGLRKNVHIIVATPGRMCDLIRRKKIKLHNISTLIIDEADEMLKMGFRDDLNAIIEQTPQSKNTLLFSATMSKEIREITKSYMNNPIEITIGKRNSAADNISHVYYMVNAKFRYEALKRIIDYYPGIYGIVFCRTRRETKDVAASLMKDAYNAEALHGDLTQAQRNYVMQKFREKNLNILVATDVAARGIDVNDLSHVINFNLPDDPEVYTHRTGRTGRAGKTGMAISIINLKEKGRIAQIERFIGKKVEQKEIPQGEDICKKQLFHMIENMQKSNIREETIAKYMPEVYEMLESLSKEEIIKRFVSIEFNRFLDYYKKNEKSYKDLVVSKKDRKEDRKKGRKGGKPKSMSRIIFNVGKGKNINKRDVIDLITNIKGLENIDIGQIEIFKRVSAVEVEATHLNKALKGLSSQSYNGIQIKAEENYEFTGNDYRDRTKRRKPKHKR